ncbi:MAG: hypothetical protein Q8R04_02870 [Nanoarchaeota archaeon]|nr:hypothetical protein [Nanoarchaeota archaeon]
MKTSVHLLASLVFAALLYPIFNWKVIFILVGGVLIDVDHYLWYIYKYKKFNIIDSYKFYIKNIKMDDFTNVLGILLIFHTIEFLLVALFLSFYIDFILLFTMGLLIHHLLDLIWLYSVPKRFIVNHSIILWLIKNQIQKI